MKACYHLALPHSGSLEKMLSGHSQSMFEYLRGQQQQTTATASSSGYGSAAASGGGARPVGAEQGNARGFNDMVY